jgi:hypothetical protein
MALEAYQAEGQEMYNQVAMLGEADANEYQKIYNAWSASFDTAKNIWNQDYSIWEGKINQAYNSANLQISEHNQLVNDAYNLYNAASNQYETQYAKEYKTWSDMVSQAQSYATMLNSDYWSQTELDYKKDRDAVTDSQWQQTFDFNKEQAGISQSNWEKEYGLEVNKYKVSTGDTNGDGILSDAEIAKMNTTYTYDEKGNVVTNNKKTDTSKVTPTQRQKALKAYEEGGIKGLEKEVASYGYGEDSEEEKDIMSYVNSQADTNKIPYSSRTWTVIDDGGTNWFGGVDNDVIVEDENGNQVKLSEVKKQDKELAKKLSKLAKGETYKP